MDVLNLLEGQGDIFMYDGLVFLELHFITDIMKPLVDHTFTLDFLKSQGFNESVEDYINDKESSQPTEHRDLKKALRDLVSTGKLDMPIVLHFLWRNTGLSPADYIPVVRLLVESGIIFLSSFQTGNGHITTMEKSLEMHPVVIYRLPSKPNRASTKEVWPEACPANQEQIEMHIEMPAGCPPSVAAHFTARFHSKGHCIYAWLKGAMVETKGKTKSHDKRS